jgi:hypothetical protein
LRPASHGDSDTGASNIDPAAGSDPPGLDEIIDGAACGNDQVEAFSG